MKAILIPKPGGPEALVYGQTADPVPGPNEVVVNVRAAGVNRADLLQAAGRYPPPKGASEILGLEAAGETDTGERVFFLLAGGGYAEKVAVDRGLLMPIPPRLSFEEAAAVPEAWLTAYLNLFREGMLREGELVLIHAAASGVGTAALQLARRAGARTVATTRSAWKMEALWALGADLTVDTSTESFAERIEAVYGPCAVNLVLDSVGGASLAENVRVLSPLGRLVLIATMAGPVGELDLRVLLTRRLRIVGSTLRARPLPEKVDLSQTFVRELLPGLDDGTLRPILDNVFPLAEASEALRRMAANQSFGKIVLKV